MIQYSSILKFDDIDFVLRILLEITLTMFTQSRQKCAKLEMEL